MEEQTVKAFLLDERGATAIEYGITVGITALVAITVSKMLASSAAGVLTKAAEAVVAGF